MLKETTRAFDEARTHDLFITSQTSQPTAIDWLIDVDADDDDDDDDDDVHVVYLMDNVECTWII